MLGTIKKIGFTISAVILILLIICGLFFPQVVNDKLPYRFYTVLTNSMEPKIPTHSIVFVKTYNSGMEIQKNDIITFQAKRFGEDIIITHRFSHTEIGQNGEPIYRTHPEESNVIDPYETTHDDILGVYVFHIPYLGKAVLFLKSRFGFLWLCEILLIVLINKTLRARWEENGSITIKTRKT